MEDKSLEFPVSTLQIDENALDVEWREQPSRYMACMMEAIASEHEMNLAKERFEKTKATLYIEIRVEMDTNKEKYTEPLLDSIIKKKFAYVNANREYLDSLAAWHQNKAMVNAFEQRKCALENLVKLQLAGYYSQPRDQGVADQMVQKNQEKIEDSLNVRRRKK